MTEPNEALKPCPFCGGEAELREWDWPYVRFQCRCSKCKCQARARMADRQSAITAWNTRADATENAALREKLAERKWQPIETAPRDGTPILGFRADLPKCQIGVIAWHESKHEIGLDHWNGSNGYSVMLMHPSYWMPLPKPPALTGGDNAEG